jgi:hypothetical protein
MKKSKGAKLSNLLGKGWIDRRVMKRGGAADQAYSLA